MAGILTTIREEWAEFLRNDEDSGARAFFTDAKPVIPIYTEKLRTLEQAITDGLKTMGLTVLIATVTAKKAQNQIPGKLAFTGIVAVARVYENPVLNHTGMNASDCAEVVAEFTRKFSVFGSPMMLQGIELGNDPRAVNYDVLYTVDAKSAVSTTRPAPTP